MPIFSNVEEVSDFFRRMFEESGFEMPLSEDRNLGEVCVDLIVGSIQVRAQRQQGVDEAWDANSEEYLKEKLEDYNEDRVNYQTSQMLSGTSLRGDTAITSKLVTMKYGTGRPPEGSTGPYKADSPIDLGLGGADAPILAHESRPRSTDTAKAGWAHAQGRSFYGIGDEAERIHILAGIAFANHAQKEADRP